MRPFDVVRTPKGSIAVITETDGDQASIDYLPNQKIMEHNAWWDRKELVVLGNLIELIGNAMAHPMGGNDDQGTIFFGIKKSKANKDKKV